MQKLKHFIEMKSHFAITREKARHTLYWELHQLVDYHTTNQIYVTT